jgi:futalosine hydrolase
LQHRPDIVVLAGIAGSLDALCSVGEAYEFHRVRSYGIGVGDGEQFQSAGEIGWRHVEEETDTIPEGVGDVLQKTDAKRKLDNQFGIDAELLSVCAASSSQSEARVKKKRYADALAEDMEGFAVATACVIHSVPWVIVRGISNKAGDRDKENWQADRALQKTAERVSEILAGK